MNKLSWRIALGTMVLLGACGRLAAAAKDATDEETVWFTGQWESGPAPVEGYETIAVAKPTPVTITRIEGNRIGRTSTLRNGNQVTVEFFVRSFGQNFPWWSVDGGANLVARKVDENTFDLAGVGPMGKADWARASRHTRVSPDETESETPPEKP